MSRRLAAVAQHVRPVAAADEAPRKKSSAEECVAHAGSFSRSPALSLSHRTPRVCRMSSSSMAARLARGAQRRPSEAPPATGTVWNDEASTLGGGGSLRGKTVFIAGGSRGIGFCIAKTAARDGANVVVSGKTAEPHPTLPGTIFTAAEECEALGGKALACVVDVRDEASIEAAVAAAVTKFGGIDVLINCASAIFPQATEDFNTNRFNLMFEVGPRGSMLTAKHCLPHLKKSAAAGRNPHVLNLSPPIVQKNIGQLHDQ